MIKTCRYCNEDKDETEFPTAGVIKGKHYRRWKCNACYVKMKTNYKKKQRAGFIEYKKTLKCEKCGFDDYRALQFHHNGNKLFNVGEGSQTGSLKRTLDEAAKCKVLCANCHQIEHFQEIKI